ncbi:beta-ribofuranosylaminobenzene 5'-phosphate synthase family protein [Pyrococcus abyssi]|uniref:Beta-ribofuranosylaminobenzene 5'-phosphate synthase n=1 Tax=Pyrococcus abyssi (strain GE5 / Orsay) TaxID=272844 RepID=Q9UZX9_PYRAB|nr:beta-ribofuranosylaminobenzene 5'-phosphate synthase family protein [Pyrococcus abyssi]CAB49927.1 ghmP kinase putative ATP-binding protein [Pyrococcus abyssi GE5]CCE70425.1 TPA: GHMP kinase [Pyrococcus abyssi GE5]
MIVRTPRRLHLGMIDPTGSLGRRFGSIGVALEGGYEIKVTPAGSLTIEADEEDRKVIERVVKELNLKYETGLDYYIEVRRSIPRHIGLGSTTQLTLAIASAILRIAKKEVPIEDVAFSLGRSRESGASLYVFKYGGLVIDGGVKDKYPPLVMRHEFPENWAFLLVIPKVKRGLSEEEEKDIMFGSNFGKVEIAKEISHRLLLGLIPALVERDIESFGRFLSEIQELVGSHFSTFQGGTFREDIGIIVEILKELTYGAGQSSWGPTVYGLIKKEEFNLVKTKVIDSLNDYGIKAEVELGIPRNKGAEIVGENLFLERLISGVK